MDDLRNSCEPLSYRDAQSQFLTQSRPKYPRLAEIENLVHSLGPVSDSQDILSCIGPSPSIPVSDYVSCRLGFLTPEEFDLAQNILGLFLQVASGLSLPPVFPWHDIVDGLLVLRVLQALGKGSDRSLSSLEFANMTGCGATLSALSATPTYSVPFGERAFSLQSRLLTTLHCSNQQPFRSTLLPWWEWLTHEEFKADVIIGNSWLISLPLTIQETFLARLRDILTRGESGVLLLYLRPGETFFSWRGFWSILNSFGFILVHFDDAFCIFVFNAFESFATKITEHVNRSTKPPLLDLIVPPKHFEWLRTVLEDGR